MSIYNFSKILKHKNLAKNTESDFHNLIHVRLEPTEICNFSCRFCPTQDPLRLKNLKANGYDGDNRKFEKNRILNLVDELKEVGVQAISIVAVGDPLVYPHIESVIERCIQHNFHLGLTSNFAMNLKPSLKEKLANFTWLRWSMNGGSESVYVNTNRPKNKNPLNAYLRVQENITDILKIIKQKKTNTEINASYVVSEWNCDDIGEATSLAKKLDINCISFRPDMMIFNARQNQKLKNIENKIQNFMKIKEKEETENFKVFIESEREKDNFFSNDKDLVCYYSNHSLYIAANGDVYPCCYTRTNKKYVIGSVKNQSFTDFWKSKRVKEHYKKLNINSCPSCPYTNINSDLKKIYKDNFEINHMPILKSNDYFV